MMRAPRSPARALVVAASILLGIACLEAWLALLWPERASVGLSMLVAGGLTESSSSAHKRPMLGYWEISAWLLILGGILFARLLEARPRLAAALTVRWQARGQIAVTLASQFILYSSMGVLAAAIEHLFTFHFTTTIAHYMALATVIAGLLFAGRRWPFDRLQLLPGPDDADHRARRRRWDLALLILGASLYWQWMSYERLSRFEYSLSTLQTALMQSLNLPFGILLGLGILKSSLPSRVDGTLSCLERRAPEEPGSPGLRSSLLTWLAHLGVVATLLAAARFFWAWSHQLWIDGRWLVPPEQPQRLLGVDWYWATVWEGVTAAEVFVLALWVACILASLTTWWRRPPSSLDDGATRASGRAVSKSDQRGTP